MSNLPLHSLPTRGRTIDYAAWIYDWVEPWCFLGEYQKFIKILITTLNLSPEHQILDVGCGTGMVTHIVSLSLDAQLGGRIIGIDAAAKMIQKARQTRTTPTCFFDLALAESLPFLSQTFDRILSTMFFHHLPLDIKRSALEECFRVLKPGGWLIVADMHTPSTWTGRIIAWSARWLLFQPEIEENIRGILPQLIIQVGFVNLQQVAEFGGYITLFRAQKL